MTTAGVAKVDKVSLGVDGTHDGAVEISRDAGGEMTLKDAGLTATLAQLWDRIGAHNLSSHADFAAVMGDYYTKAQVEEWLKGSLGNEPMDIITPPDVAGHTFLWGHLQDAAIHQRVGKYVLEVAKEGKEYGTIGAALVAAAGLTRGATDWIVVKVWPGTYVEAVVVSVPRLVLLGVGGPEAVTVRHDHNSDLPGEWQPALAVRASNVVVCGITAKNLFTVSPIPAVEAAIAIGVGTRDGLMVCENVVFRDCVVVGNGRDSFYARCGGSVLVDGCDIFGYSHSPAFETSAGDGAVVNTLSVIVRNTRTTGTYAAWWIFAGASETLNIYADGCDVGCTAGEAWFYLNARLPGVGTTNITAHNCRAEGLALYQTTDWMVGSVANIELSNVVCVAKSVGVAYGTVTVVDEPVAGVSAWGDVVTKGALRVATEQGPSTTVPILMAGSGAELLSLDRSDASPQYSLMPTDGDTELIASRLMIPGQAWYNGLTGADVAATATLTTKGDLYVATAAGTLARLPAPPAGHALIADSSQATGWTSIFVPRVVAFSSTTSSELSNHTAVTPYDQYLTIPANTLAVGQIWRVRLAGFIWCAADSQFQARIKFPTTGGADLTWGSITAYNGWSSQPWEVFATFIVKAIGASGSIRNHEAGTVMRGTYSTHNHSDLAINTTIANPLLGCASWAVANVGNKSVQTSATLERLA